MLWSYESLAYADKNLIRLLEKEGSSFVEHVTMIVANRSSLQTLLLETVTRNTLWFLENKTLLTTHQRYLREQPRKNNNNPSANLPSHSQVPFQL